MDGKYADKRLVAFKKECILVGPVLSVRGFYNFLNQLGATIDEKNVNKLLHSQERMVLLLRNEGTIKKFPRVKVLNREWWDFWHNKRKNPSRTVIKTYNIPKQWKEVCEKVLLVEDKPLLIPEK